jgi:hypothetical protein
MGASDAAHYIDLRALIDRQRGERYRSLLILAEDAGERSRQARRLAKGIGAHYLNVLDTFEERPELCARIDRIGIDELEDLLLNLEVPQELVVVDAIDVLLNTWHREQRESFTWILLDQRLDTLERDAKLFVFFALEDVYLRQHDLLNTEGERRILRLCEVSF